MTTIDNNAIVAAIDNATAIEDAQAIVRLCEQNLSDAKAKLRTLRGQATQSKSAPRECECGCAGVTSGGKFLPGHDAKMRSRLLTEIRDGESEESERAALATLQTYDKLAHGIGDWDLGRDRKIRVQKEARAEQAKADKAARDAQVTTDKANRAKLQERSKAEAHAAQEQRLANKDRAIEAAKSGKM